MLTLAALLAAPFFQMPLLDTDAPGKDKQTLLIVSPRALQSALAPYLEHKGKQMKVELALLEDVIGGNPMGDPPEALKRFVFAGWKQRKVKYLLLVGDADQVPVRYMVLDRVTSQAFDYAFYPSDLYYGDLAKPDGSFENWNARNDGFHREYYGEVRGEKNKKDPINFDKIDYKPEIGVGRWPVSTVDQLKPVIAKTIAYEKAVQAAKSKGIRTAALIGVDGWVDCRSLMDELSGNLPEGWNAEKRYGGERPSPTPAPTSTEVVNLLNGGLSLILHTGHGSDEGWHRSISSGDLSRLTNAAGLPIMFSAGCSTGRFATLPPYEPYEDVFGKHHLGTVAGEVFTSPPPPPNCFARGPYNKSGLGEKAVLLPNAGAVAYIGCNTGSQPAALTLMRAFVAALHDSKKPRLGDLWKSAVSKYYDDEHLATLAPNSDWYPPSIFFQAMKFMVYGDPSLLLPVPKKEP